MVAGTLSGFFGTHIDRVMELARRHLEMDVVLLSEFSRGKQFYRALDGDSSTFGLSVGAGIPLETTYCDRLVKGEIPNVIPDTALNDQVRDLAATRDAAIGSYIGIPLRLSNGQVYGTFCALSHDRKELNSRDVHFLSMLGELVVDELDAKRQHDEQRAGIAAIISDERLRVALQPVVCLQTGNCLGVEALSRFPTGFGSPDAVFASAAEVGLDFELERLAVGQAIQVLPRLPEHQFLSVNLSPSVALNLGLEVPGDRDHLLKRLVVEITEHAAVAGYAELRERLQPYRDRGLRLAIDDAGAGYASLHHIVELEPDIIKIDRSLIHGVSTDRGRRSVVSALVLLALDLQAVVVAEGIEDVEDFFAAGDLGVDAAQGFLFARPSTSRRSLARWSADTITLPNRTIDVAAPAVARIGASAGSSGFTSAPEPVVTAGSHRLTVNF